MIRINTNTDDRAEPRTSLKEERSDGERGVLGVAGSIHVCFKPFFSVQFIDKNLFFVYNTSTDSSLQNNIKNGIIFKRLSEIKF